MKNYAGHYNFKCENAEIQAEGRCFIDFIYDEETDETSNVKIDIIEKKVFDVIKEQTVIKVLQRHIKDIHNMICADAINYALEHDLTDDF